MGTVGQIFGEDNCEFFRLFSVNAPEEIPEGGCMFRNVGWYPSTRLDDVITKTITVWIFIILTTSNLMLTILCFLSGESERNYKGNAI